MAIEFEDMLLLKEINQQWPLAGRVLILGDCDFHFKSRDLSLALEKFLFQKHCLKNSFNFQWLTRLILQATLRSFMI